MIEMTPHDLQTSNTAIATVGAESQRCSRKSDRVAEAAVRLRIAKSSAYAFHFRDVTCTCSAGVAKVCGRVPTERLKQALWSLILGVHGIREIDDQLDVVSATGLSSICPR